MPTCQIGQLYPLKTFKWTIPSILTSLPTGYDCISSPMFNLGISHWFLSLSLRSEKWIGIFLCRTPTKVTEKVTYTLRLQDRYGTVEITKTDRFHIGFIASGQEEFLEKEEALNRIFQHPFTVTCYIGFDTPDPVRGKVIAHYFEETTVPKRVSCAIQTEDASSMIDKENSKNENWSSLNTKDDALLRDRMKELLTKGSDHDVTICVQDKEFRAHRNILSTRSPVFAMMLSHDTKENNTGTISIEDCDPESFEEFLLYVYSGRTENLSPSNALQLYYPADKYDFPVLKERCVSLLKASLSVESICDVVLLAAKHHEKHLLEVATEFFARHIKKIIVTVDWQNFLSQNPVEANELYIRSMAILLPEN